ncbi:MAG TPA: histidine kinase, partial [Anaerolineae bacterium]|nr:histidine kinase [Anaerolineae bacterium]
MTATSLTPDHASRLSGRALTAARAGWLVIASLSIAIFIGGVIQSAGGLTGDAGVIRQAGLSPALVAAIRLIRLGLFAGVYVVTGAIIFWRKSDEVMALITSLMLIVFGTTAFANVPIALARAYPIWQVPALALIALGSILSGLFFYTFPDGRFVPAWTRYLLVLWGAWNIANLASGIPAVLNVSVTLIFVGSFIGVQAYRYRRVSNGVQRQQTKWVVAGCAAALGAFMLFRLAPWPFDYPSLFKDLIYVSGATLGLLIVPLAIGLAVLRYRLWDIDLIINRTLVYGTLTLSTMALYGLVIGYFSVLFQTSANFVFAFIATGLVAVIFEPLRERLQRSVNRLMYGERDEPAAVLTRLSQRLEAVLAPEAALPAIVETVLQALRLPYAAILLHRPSGDLEIAAEVGRVQTDLIQWPLLYQSTRVGELRLAPRSKGEPFSPADQRLLGIIAQQAGVVVHAVRLTDELRQLTVDLQHSRERLVTTQEEERRRLRRELHDGVGPTLASLMQRLDVAADLVPRDPQSAVQVLLELKQQTKRAIADIRQVVYALRPPVLDEFGLVSAIREHVAPYDGPAGLRVTIEAPEPMPSLSAAVEVAAYRIALEAFTNVVRHAHASECHVALALTAEALAIDVTDDGVG